MPNTLHVGSAIEIGDNGGSAFVARLTTTTPLTADRSVVFPNATCDLTFASQMDQSVATSTSPTFQQPLCKLGLDIEDPGAGTKKVTLNAASGLASDYTITLPATLPAQDNVLSVSSVAGSVATTSFIDNVPSATLGASGFVSWGAFSGGAGVYWAYTRPTFTLQCAGYGYICGKRVTWTAPQTVACVANEANYIYIDANGVLRRTNTTTTDTNIYINDLPLFELLDDGVVVTPLVKKENHSVQFSPTIAEYLHRNVGNVIRGNGAIMTRKTTGTGAAITDLQFYIVGEDYNEDHGLITYIPDGGGVVQTATYYYKNAAGKWIIDSSSATPPLKWNNAGVSTALGATKRAIIRMYVTLDSLNTATPQYVGVLHTAEFANLSLANAALSAGTIVAADNELASMELTQLGYLVVVNSGANGYIEQITMQKSTFNSRYVSGTSAGSHLTLTDLTGGQYRDGGHSQLVQRNSTTSPPAITDDIGTYRVGSIWVDTNTSNAYVCADNTASHAIWHGLGWWNSLVPETNKGSVACGFSALTYAPASTYNIAIGYQALYGNLALANYLTGTDNYAIGQKAMLCSAATPHTCEYNCAFGYEALKSLTTGAYNITVGALDCAALTTGSYNIVLGRSNMPAQVDGIQNIIIGDANATLLNRNGGADTVGGYAIVLGSNCLTSATSVMVPTVIGKDAGNTITGGNWQIIIGYGADAGATTQAPVAIGAFSTASGDLSVAIGGGSGAGLGATSSGAESISIGRLSKSQASGSVAIGYGANVISTATDSICIGRAATCIAAVFGITLGRDLPNDFNNHFRVGTGTGGSEAYSYHVMGTSSGFTGVSSRSLKKDIAAIPYGLNFVDKLQPVTFRYNNSQAYGDRIYSGFIAEDVFSTMNELGITEMDAINWSDVAEKRGLSITGLIPSMTRAIQELSGKVRTLETELAAVKVKVGLE